MIQELTPHASLFSKNSTSKCNVSGAIRIFVICFKPPVGVQKSDNLLTIRLPNEIISIYFSRVA